MLLNTKFSLNPHKIVHQPVTLPPPSVIPFPGKEPITYISHQLKKGKAKADLFLKAIPSN